MRVAFLTETLDLDNGWGRYSHRLIEQLPALGIEPRVLVMQGRGRGTAPEGIELDACLPPGRPSLDRFALLSAALRVRSRTRGCDVVHALVEPYTRLAALAAGRRPLFVTGHGTYLVQPFESGGSPRRTFRAYARAAGVLCVSRYTRDRLLHHCPELSRACVIPLAVEPRFLSPAPRPLDPGEKIVLSVGALKERKGYEYTIRAFAKVRKQVPDARYVIVGAHRKPRYARHITDLIADHGLEDAVALHPDVDDEGLLAWYRRASLFVLASTNEGPAFEGFGLVHLEANAAGIPTIGCLDSGNEDAIRHGETGMLVPQRDVDALADAMIGLLSDDERRMRMGEAGRAFAGARGWDRVAAEVVEAYEAC